MWIPPDWALHYVGQHRDRKTWNHITVNGIGLVGKLRQQSKKKKKKKKQ